MKWPWLCHDFIAYNHGMQIRICLPHLGGLAACLALLWAFPVLQAQNQAAGPGLIVTYVEAAPAKGAELAADLKAFALQIEAGPGKPAVAVLKEVGRPNRMVVIEQWPDLSSPDFAASEAALTAKVKPDALAPMDRHVSHPMAPALDQPSSTAFVVLMHVDIGRDLAATAPKILQAQRSAVMSAPGAVGYEVAVQDQRTNHFAVWEIWKSRAAYESYTATAPAKELRSQLAPLLGSPFDDRFYASAEH
jgi:quinol monooxygenase YgiN